MDEKLRFVSRFLDGEKIAALCREFGISRATGHKSIDRHRESGLEAFTDRSRRPYGRSCRWYISSCPPFLQRPIPNRRIWPIYRNQVAVAGQRIARNDCVNRLASVEPQYQGTGERLVFGIFRNGLAAGDYLRCGIRIDSALKHPFERVARIRPRTRLFARPISNLLRLMPFAFWRKALPPCQAWSLPRLPHGRVCDLIPRRQGFSCQPE